MINVNEERVILGIDPGTRFMGYGVLRAKGARFTYIDMGVVNLSRETDNFVRLERIHEEVCRIVELYKPDCISIETPFFGKNIQSLIKLGRAQGVAIAAGMGKGVKIFEYAPLRIKQALTGNGAASKQQVCAMVYRLLNLSEDDVAVPNHLDATDAMAAAVCHGLHARYGQELRTGGTASVGAAASLSPGKSAAKSGSHKKKIDTGTDRRRKTKWSEFVARNPELIIK